MSSIEICVEGILYPSIKVASEKYNLKRLTVCARLRKNWSIEEAFGIKERQEKCNGIIYKITNSINSKVYIGVTVASINQRFSGHKYSARKGEKTKLYLAMRRLGVENFKINLIKRASSLKELQRLEIVFIKKYDSINIGYNDRLGGGLFGNNIGTMVEYKGNTFKSDVELAQHLGIKPITLYTRKSRGVEIDKPIQIIKAPQKYKGVAYPSIAALANHLNINVGTLRCRIRNNIPVDQPLRYSDEYYRLLGSR